MKTNGAELRAECVRKGITLESLASKIGINPTSLYRKINGESEFRRNELQIIKNVLELDDEKFIIIFFTYQLAKTQERSN